MIENFKEIRYLQFLIQYILALRLKVTDYYVYLAHIFGEQL